MIASAADPVQSATSLPSRTSVTTTYSGTGASSSRSNRRFEQIGPHTAVAECPQHADLDGAQIGPTGQDERRGHAGGTRCRSAYFPRRSTPIGRSGKSTEGSPCSPRTSVVHRHHTARTGPRPTSSIRSEEHHGHSTLER